MDGTVEYESIEVRLAVPEDNLALIELTSLCPMEGDIGMCVSREPDFFALNRLEGEVWSVAVAQNAAGTIVGCAGVAERDVYIAGEARRILYVGDLKVHPDYRRRGVSRKFAEWVRARAENPVVGEGPLPVVAAILSGNVAAELLAVKNNPLPFSSVGVIRVHSIMLTRKRQEVAAGLTVARATPGDLDEMVALWQRLGPARTFTHVHDRASFERWIHHAPALSLADYLLCRNADGGLVAFAGLWDQRSFKRLRVTRFSPSLATFRLLYNASTVLTGGHKLPAAGEYMDYASLVNVCAEDAAALRSLLGSVLAQMSSSDCVFVQLGLDRSDPLADALARMGARTDDVSVLMAEPGRTTLERPVTGLVRHEIALV